MASRRGSKICVLFEKTPEGTHYKKGRYSYVDKAEAKDLINKGYGAEYDPEKGKKVNEPAKSTSKPPAKSKSDKK